MELSFDNVLMIQLQWFTGFGCTRIELKNSFNFKEHTSQLLSGILLRSVADIIFDWSAQATTSLVERVHYICDVLV